MSVKFFQVSVATSILMLVVIASLRFYSLADASTRSLDVSEPVLSRGSETATERGGGLTFAKVVRKPGITCSEKLARDRKSLGGRNAPRWLGDIGVGGFPSTNLPCLLELRLRPVPQSMSSLMRSIAEQEDGIPATVRLKLRIGPFIYTPHRLRPCGGFGGPHLSSYFRLYRGPDPWIRIQSWSRPPVVIPPVNAVALRQYSLTCGSALPDRNIPEAPAPEFH